jgi:geranylgeranyl pyrophosphate synthase
MVSRIFASKRWNNRPFTFEETTRLSQILIDDGVQDWVEKETARLTGMAKDALETLPEKNSAYYRLLELADRLLKRSK